MLLDWQPAAGGEPGSGDLGLHGCRVEELAAEDGSFEGLAECELELEFDEATGAMSWTHDAGLYTAASVARMAERFVAVAARCAAQPDGRIPPPLRRFGGRVTQALPDAAGCARRVAAWQARVRAHCSLL